MKLLPIASALLLLAFAPVRGGIDPGIRLAVMPMAGLVGQLELGAGVDVSMGYGRAAWGIHYVNAKGFCVLCDPNGVGPETEIQFGLLAGLREELSFGSISLKSGITRLERDSKDYGREYPQGPFLRRYRGFGVPFQLDLVLSGRCIGLALSATVLADADGGSASLLAGTPFGLLRK